MKSRIYFVSVKGTQTEGTLAMRLVRATTVGQAVKHVATPMIVAHIPTQDELVAFGAKGLKIEDATKEVK